mmetsp:Transcript_52051/g.111414  ORF Transcript_52051/g.111414 Transcript_52051/m.111414 type:complete len:267 (+) Transcript_52051:853-1653(+)
MKAVMPRLRQQRPGGRAGRGLAPPALAHGVGAFPWLCLVVVASKDGVPTSAEVNKADEAQCQNQEDHDPYPHLRHMRVLRAPCFDERRKGEGAGDAASHRRRDAARGAHLDGLDLQPSRGPGPGGNRCRHLGLRRRCGSSTCTIHLRLAQLLRQIGSCSCGRRGLSTEVVIRLQEQHIAQVGDSIRLGLATGDAGGGTYRGAEACVDMDCQSGEESRSRGAVHHGGLGKWGSVVFGDVERGMRGGVRGVVRRTGKPQNRPDQESMA